MTINHYTLRIIRGFFIKKTIVLRKIKYMILLKIFKNLKIIFTLIIIIGFIYQ